MTYEEAQAVYNPVHSAKVRYQEKCRKYAHWASQNGLNFAPFVLLTNGRVRAEPHLAAQGDREPRPPAHGHDGVRLCHRRRGGRGAARQRARVCGGGVRVRVRGARWLAAPRASKESNGQQQRNATLDTIPITN
ncbi:hypothetical protein ERJ75_001285500 [Trypanosoma vivax]|nr:hypothetical protein ERJ75_001285500 [Trypanosoma vivax]